MLNEQQFEELLQIVIPEVCYEEICEIEEQMLKEGKHVFSEEFERNMESVFKGKKSILNEVTAKKRKTKPKFKYLLVAILLFILSSITVLAYEPARQALKDFFFTIYNEYIIVEPLTEEKNDVDDVIFYRPEYVPDMYKLEHEVIDESIKEFALLWMNEDGDVLLYQQTTLQNSRLIISSDGDRPIDIKIGEYDGKIIVEEDGLKTLFYENNGWIFLISGVLEENELIQIMMSIK